MILRISKFAVDYFLKLRSKQIVYTSSISPQCPILFAYYITLCDSRVSIFRPQVIDWLDPRVQAVLPLRRCIVTRTMFCTLWRIINIYAFSQSTFNSANNEEDHYESYVFWCSILLSFEKSS